MANLQVNRGKEAKLYDTKMIRTRNGARLNKATRNENEFVYRDIGFCLESTRVLGLV